MKKIGKEKKSWLKKKKIHKKIIMINNKIKKIKIIVDQTPN